MTFKSSIVGCVTALLGAAFTAGCSTAPTSHEDTTTILNKIPDRTVVDPKTGCRYLKDDKNPQKPVECLNSDFPQQHIK